jgi:hypothetical protein
MALEARLGAALTPLLTALRLPLRPPGARGSKLCMPAGLETPADRVAVLAGLQRAYHMQPLWFVPMGCRALVNQLKGQLR